MANARETVNESLKTGKIAAHAHSGVPYVYRCRDYFYQYFIVLGGGLYYLFEVKNLRWRARAVG